MTPEDAHLATARQAVRQGRDGQGIPAAPRGLIELGAPTSADHQPGRLAKRDRAEGHNTVLKGSAAHPAFRDCPTSGPAVRGAFDGRGKRFGDDACGHRELQHLSPVRRTDRYRPVGMPPASTSRSPAACRSIWPHLASSLLRPKFVICGRRSSIANRSQGASKATVVSMCSRSNTSGRVPAGFSIFNRSREGRTPVASNPISWVSVLPTV